MGHEPWSKSNRTILTRLLNRVVDEKIKTTSADQGEQKPNC